MSMVNILKQTFSTGSVLPKKRVEFFYDVISPYSWFAFEVLMRYKKHWSIDVDLKPMLLAGVTKATGNSAPMLVPNKGRYMFEDLKRNNKYFDVPLKMVSDPFNLIMEKGSIIPSRFLTAVSVLYPTKLEQLTRALWYETWNQDQDFTTKEVLSRAAESAGLNGSQIEELLTNITKQETKDLLRKNTDDAIEYGAFGSPTIIVHTDEPHLFFGSDRFPLIAQELGEVWKGPLPDKINSSL